MKPRTVLMALAVSLIIASPAMAHPLSDGAHFGGLGAGFFHPLSGLDHLLVMFTVGLLAIWIGGSAIWLLPSAFLGSLFLGGLIGLAGLNVVLIETLLALSVLLLGCALMVRASNQNIAAVLIVGGIGFLHGHAHGTEIPAMTGQISYFVGFLTASIFLQLAGLTTGTILTRSKQGELLVRFSGAAISALGLCLLVGAF